MIPGVMGYQFLVLTMTLDIFVFFILLFLFLYLFFIRLRPSMLETPALLTLALYFTVSLARFVRCFLSEEDRLSPVQTGISLACHSLISLAMYYFVFEMQAVMDQLRASDSYDFKAREQRRKRNKTLVMSLGIAYTLLYVSIRVHMALGHGLGAVEELVYIATFSIKPVLDFFAIYLFVNAFLYFYR